MDERDLDQMAADFKDDDCLVRDYIAHGKRLIAEVRRLQQEAQEAHAEVNALRAQTRLLTHKVITCGVAASHPDPHLTSKKPCYAETWNSPQAEAVRQLRAQRDAALAERDIARG